MYSEFLNSNLPILCYLIPVFTDTSIESWKKKTKPNPNNKTKPKLTKKSQPKTNQTKTPKTFN